MEASAIPASVGLARPRVAIGASLLRIRSDEQLVTLFREGNDDAFRVIHDRYRGRMVAYTRQMLGATGQDPEDAVQEIFVRAYYGLRANHRHLVLRAWLYRIAHNRCIDDLRRPHPVTVAVADQTPARTHDPVIKAEQRDALRRLIADVQRLPEHQRSALLMRELSGMPYTEVSDALGVSVPAVKSLLVRARISLAQASEARNTACADIRADVILAHDRGVRTSGMARRHMRECPSCRQFRAEVRGVSHQLAALTPTLGPLGLLAKLLGLGGGGGAAASGGAVAGGSAVGGTVGTSAGVLAGSASHVVTLLAAAVVTAGGAVEIQRTLTPANAHRTGAHHAATDPAPAMRPAPAPYAPPAPTIVRSEPSSPGTSAPAATPAVISRSAAQASRAAAQSATAAARAVRRAPITMVLDPDMYLPPNPNAGSSGPGSTVGTHGSTSTTGASTGSAGSSSASTGATSTGTGANKVSGSTGTPTSPTSGSTAASGSVTTPTSGGTQSSSGGSQSTSSGQPASTSVS